MTVGTSPKLIAAVISAVIAYLITQTALELSPGVVVVCQAVAIAVAAYLADPGDVVSQVGPASDDLLLTDRDVRKKLTDERG